MQNLLTRLSDIFLPKRLKYQLLQNWNIDGIKKYATNTGWTFAARISMMAISFLSIIYIARNLGPANFGELSYAISFVSIFSFIATFGIDAVLFRELAHTPEKKDALLGTALRLRTYTALLAIASCITSAVLFSPADVSFYLIVLISLTFLFQTFFIIQFEFQAAVYTKTISILAVAVTLILNILKVGVIYFDQGVIYLAATQLLESVLFSVGYVYLRKRHFGSLRAWYFDKHLAILLLKKAWPLLFSTAFVLIYARIDQIMLKHILDATSVGLYDAAIRLIEVWNFIPGIIVSSLFPAIVYARKHSQTEYSKRVRALFYLILFLTIAIALPIFLGAHLIVDLVFGSAFAASAGVLQLYIWAFIPLSFILLAKQVLLAEGATKVMFFISLLSMTVNVIGNYFLIPSYGIMGAAAATLISSTATGLVVSLLIVYYIKKHSPSYAN